MKQGTLADHRNQKTRLITTTTGERGGTKRDNNNITRIYDFENASDEKRTSKNNLQVTENCSEHDAQERSKHKDTYER